MGAGKGKNKRTQAASTPVAPVTTVGRWQSFVAQHGLVGMPTADYYQKKLNSVDDAVALAQEILLDLDATGALVFPSGATVDGLQVRKQNGGKVSGHKVLGDVIVLETRNPRARTRKVLISDDPGALVAGAMKLGHAELTSFVYEVANAVEAMFPTP